MSLSISFEDFEKMVDKECQKQVGLSLADMPNVFCEDYWPVDFDGHLTVHDAKEAVLNCVNSVIEDLGNTG
jgi:hypothetical protein